MRTREEKREQAALWFAWACLGAAGCLTLKILWNVRVMLFWVLTP